MFLEISLSLCFTSGLKDTHYHHPRKQSQMIFVCVLSISTLQYFRKQVNTVVHNLSRLNFVPVGRCVSFPGLPWHSTIDRVQHKLVSSQFWRLEIWGQGVSQVVISVASRKDPSFPLPASDNPGVPLLAAANSNLYIHLYKMFSMCLCALTYSTYKDTNHTGLGAHSTSVWRHLN